MCLGKAQQCKLKKMHSNLDYCFRAHIDSSISLSLTCLQTLQERTYCLVIRKILLKKVKSDAACVGKKECLRVLFMP